MRGGGADEDVAEEIGHDDMGYFVCLERKDVGFLDGEGFAAVLAGVLFSHADGCGVVSLA